MRMGGLASRSGLEVRSCAGGEPTGFAGKMLGCV